MRKILGNFIIIAPNYLKERIPTCIHEKIGTLGKIIFPLCVNRIRFTEFAIIFLHTNNCWVPVVVLIVTLEYVLIYISILYCCTPIEDVRSAFGDVIIVYGH